MKKRILTEMAIYDEDEVFSLQPVADVTTTGLEQLEGPDFINHIVKTIDTSNLPEDYVLTNRELNEIYSHHCAYRILKKAAFLALPQILQAKLVLSSWKKKTVQDGSKSNDNRVSGLMGAPITIDNVKYLCLVGMRKNRNKIITPYTIILKDANGVIVGDKKVNSDIIVPDSNNGTSAFGSTHLSTDTASLDANSPSNANIDKNNKTEKNESKNMTKKNTIRLTESELKKVITESVKKILKEDEELKTTGYWDKRTTYSPQHYCALRDKVGAINICDMMFRILDGEMLQMLYKAYPGLRWQLSEDDIENAYVNIGPDKD